MNGRMEFQLLYNYFKSRIGNLDLLQSFEVVDCIDNIGSVLFH